MAVGTMFAPPPHFGVKSKCSESNGELENEEKGEPPPPPSPSQGSGWMDGASLRWVAPWNTGTEALIAHGPCQQALNEFPLITDPRP